MRWLWGITLAAVATCAAAAGPSELLRQLGGERGIGVKGSSLTTDISDLWGTPGESGWGVQFVQSKEKVFATMFVYDAAGNPTWYSALLDYAGNLHWAGSLNLAHGSYFGGPWQGNATGRSVGTMTFDGALVNTGTLRYTVDGVSVEKSIQRVTLVNENYAGLYAGALNLTQSGCANPASNGAVSAASFAADFTQSAAAITMRGSSTVGVVCTYSGTLTQQGRIGSVTGTYACPTGERGDFGLSELQVSLSGITGRIATASNVCAAATGNFALVRVQ